MVLPLKAPRFDPHRPMSGRCGLSRIGIGAGRRGFRLIMALTHCRRLIHSSEQDAAASVWFPDIGEAQERLSERSVRATRAWTDAAASVW
jgi:hypothetical protein